MENIETQNNKTKSFFGTFVFICLALNIIAFFIMLLTTKWSMITGDMSPVIMLHLVVSSMMKKAMILSAKQMNTNVPKKDFVLLFWVSIFSIVCQYLIK